eukprot:5639275-Ditylum_brightwellii.AAC.1
MKPTSAQPAKSFYIKDPPGIDNMVGQISGDRYKTILEAKYEKADLKKEADDNCLQLSSKQRTWKNTKYDIELKPGVASYHGRPYSISRAYKQQLRVEVERLVQIGVLQK